MSVSDDRAGETDGPAEGTGGAPQPASAAARRERSADRGSRPATRPGAAGKDHPTKPRGGTDTKVSPPARTLRFLREVVAELRKVIWPTRKQLVTYTAVVLVFVSIMVAFVALLDLGFGRAMFYVFG
ncbi:MAG TPA: preprotein translocase subunit SecE [Pseudonocardiaceae bacterium]|nr:preprotein translocase subunit SecE [Pseudonocardiaceae bacterium]